MDYITLKEASQKWGVSVRQINYYCADSRILGAVKMATIWLYRKTQRSLLTDVGRREKQPMRLTKK